MRTTRILAGVATVVCAAVMLPAGVASADDQDSAQEVISKLQDQGYNVTIDKIGTAPLSDCVVTSVRNPQEFTQLVPLLGGNQDGVLFPATISKPISVSLDCSGR
ncbi:hypothetical protein [Mycobacterium sp. 852014-52144_SCH5372336]|uniref:hypothetical protein n=1 Tax=Mycobacterium sp. 852014-52144_SCH5372336 TaxID=1834115 RepID=UPI0007FD4BDA|nr:hypothetical protein [Mycobacterium sp. 852014-52144_SCH5372336]OBB75771.1 hypothetical protein A5759_07020 [Mycobacterium sp. 852014-52144_SCH5372336]